MRLYRKKIFQDIQFDTSGYCQFLKEQGLTQEHIKALTIHLTEYQANDPYTEDIPEGETVGGSFLDTRKLLEYQGSLGPRILLHPEQHKTKHSLNDTLLEETRHYIQECLNLFPSSNWGEYEDRPEEIDAKEFVQLHQSRQFIQHHATT